MTSHEALANLREFVNNHLDGSTSRFLELDQLVWEARLASGHKPQMYHIEKLEESGPRGTAELLADIGL